MREMSLFDPPPCKHRIRIIPFTSPLFKNQTRTTTRCSPRRVGRRRRTSAHRSARSTGWCGARPRGSPARREARGGDYSTLAASAAVAREWPAAETARRRLPADSCAQKGDAIPPPLYIDAGDGGASAATRRALCVRRVRPHGRRGGGGDHAGPPPFWPEVPLSLLQAGLMVKRT